MGARQSRPAATANAAVMVVSSETRPLLRESSIISSPNARASLIVRRRSTLRGRIDDDDDDDADVDDEDAEIEAQLAAYGGLADAEAGATGAAATSTGDADGAAGGVAPVRPRSVFWTRLRYYVPVLSWLPRYSVRANLEGDVVAGMTVACLLIPQALSYAQALVKIPPVYGLYTCFVPLIVYSILGTSRQLGVGPEALVSILVGAAISEKSGMKGGGSGVGEDGGDADPADAMAENIAIANFLGLLVGVFTLLLGVFRLGFLDSVLSRALLRGFVTAVAVVVMIDLSPSLLGIKESVDVAWATRRAERFVDASGQEELSPIEKLLVLIENLGATHALTAVVSFASIGFLAGMRWLKARFPTARALQLVPEILALVALSTLLCGVFRWDELSLDILRDVKGGLIAPRLPAVTASKVQYCLLSAVLISVIGFVESIAVAKTYATK
ncbi:hypothetical protein HK405_006197 [Cladochytrium tenue]|nr:hypothetical protein HK405_006197 [Cladochytrium tenue]